jgi:hypothetical protein
MNSVAELYAGEGRPEEAAREFQEVDDSFESQ